MALSTLASALVAAAADWLLDYAGNSGNHGWNVLLPGPSPSTGLAAFPLQDHTPLCRQPASQHLQANAFTDLSRTAGFCYNMLPSPSALQLLKCQIQAVDT